MSAKLFVGGRRDIEVSVEGFSGRRRWGRWGLEMHDRMDEDL